MGFLQPPFRSRESQVPVISCWENRAWERRCPVPSSLRVSPTGWVTAGGVLETSLKFHASCRHTHPGADAFLLLLENEKLAIEDIVRVSVGVHQGALDVLNHSVAPDTISEAKFSMGCVLGLLAHYGTAGVEAFTPDTIRNPQSASL